MLELSGPANYRFFVLDAPRRAVLDIPQARLSRAAALPAPEGRIRGVRTGRPSAGTLRLVVDLAEGSRARVVGVEASGSLGPRVIIDIEAGPEVQARVPSVTTAPTTALATARDPAAVKAPHAPAESGRDVVVAIDAGHGGSDPGAIGRAGTREKDVVLGIARDLAERIDREPGMRAVLTRDGDYFLTLRQRIGRARTAKADMFVSVHADSVRDPDVSGSSVYVLSEKGASDEGSRWLAERENAADLKGGVSLDDKDNVLASVLLDLSQSASITASMEAAQRVLRALNNVAEVRKPRVQQAGFVVLKSPDIPSMLVETAFISNPGDERRLRRDEHRSDLAEAIFGGVHRYFEEHPPEGTRFALARRAAAPVAAQNAR